MKKKRFRLYIFFMISLISTVISDKINDLNQELIKLEQLKASEENNYKEISNSILKEREEIILRLNDKNNSDDKIIENLNNQLSDNLDKNKILKEKFGSKISIINNHIESIMYEIQQERQTSDHNKQARSASGNGDPHYMGFYGQRFDLHPIGDAILVINDKHSFEIHCRHNIWGNTYVTVISSCVIRLGDDLVEYNGPKNQIYGNKKLITIEDIHQVGLIKIRKINNNSYEFSSDGMIMNLGCYQVSGIAVCSFSLTLSESIIQGLGESILGNVHPGNDRKIIIPTTKLFTDEFVENEKSYIKPIESRELDEEEKEILERARKNPNLSEYDIKDIEYDIMNTPKEIREELIKINIVSMVENNINIRKNEEMMISLSNNNLNNFKSIFVSAIVIAFSYLGVKYIFKL